MESVEAALDTIRTRLKSDMRTTLRRNGMDVADDTWLNIIIDELADDAMFYVEKVIVDD